MDGEQWQSRTAGFIKMKPADLDPHCFHKMVYNFEEVTYTVCLLGQTWLLYGYALYLFFHFLQDLTLLRKKNDKMLG